MISMWPTPPSSSLQGVSRETARIRTLRHALYGSNPGHPPGQTPASIFSTDSTVPSANDVNGRHAPSFIHPRAPGHGHEDLFPCPFAARACLEAPGRGLAPAALLAPEEEPPPAADSPEEPQAARVSAAAATGPLPPGRSFEK